MVHVDDAKLNPTNSREPLAIDLPTGSTHWISIHRGYFQLHIMHCQGHHFHVPGAIAHMEDLLVAIQASRIRTSLFGA